MPDRRVAEGGSALELLREEAADVVPGRIGDRSSVGLERLDQHASRGFAAASSRKLGQQLERALLRAEVGQAERPVGVDDHRQLDPGEVVPLGDHLRPEEDGPGRLAETAERRSGELGAPRTVGIETDRHELGELTGQLTLEPLRACAEARDLGRAARRARVGIGLRVTAVVAVEDPVAMEDERDVAVRAADRPPAGAAVQCGRDPPAVEEEDRLPSRLRHPAELGEERRRERVAGLAAQIDDLHGRQRAADAPSELEPLQRGPALRPRRRRPEDRHGAFDGRALGRDRARVVAGIGVLLVGRVVLLVDHDQAEPAHRGEHRRPCPHDHSSLAARDPLTLVAPLGLGQPRMEDRDTLAEARTHAPHGLRGERDLRHEHDRAEPALEHRRARLEVDLRLAGAGRPEEQERLAGRPRRTPRRSGRWPPAARGRASPERPHLRASGGRPAAPGPSGGAAARARRARAPGPGSSRSSRRPTARARRAPGEPARRPSRSQPARRPRARRPRARPPRRGPAAARTSSRRSPPARPPPRPRR